MLDRSEREREECWTEERESDYGGFIILFGCIEDQFSLHNSHIYSVCVCLRVRIANSNL